MSSRYLRPKFAFEDPDQESVLLRSIRSALHGSKPDRDWQHSVFYDVSSEHEAEDVVEELLWDQERVVLCAGGVIQKQWSFPHEGQPVQWACNGWLQQAGVIAASRSSGHYTNDVHSGLSRERERDNNRTRATFGPFERAEQERRREVEPETRVRATFVFLRSVGWIYLRNGIEYTFSVPFIVRRAWPLYPHGVIIQRVLEPTEVQEAELTGDETLPTVFSLVSPLAEATVVDHAANIVGGFHAVPLSLVHEDDSSDQVVSEPLSAGEVIVWVSHQGHGEDSDLLVTVHPERRQLSVWRYAYVKLGDIPFSQAHSRFRKKRASMAAGAPDNQRQTFAGGEEFGWRPQSSPEDRHPLETFPAQQQHARHHASLASLQTMSSLSAATVLATGTSRSQLPLLGEPRSPPERDRLSVDVHRMVLGGRTEPDVAMGPTDYTRMRSTHWITRLYTMDLTENEYVSQSLLQHHSNRYLTPRSLIDWQKISVSVFDQRFDGQVDRSLLGVCRPVSETLTILSITKSENRTLCVTQVGEHPAVSVAPMLIMRSNVDDLLIAEPTGVLTILTHGLQKYNASTVGIAGVIPHFLSRARPSPSAALMDVDSASNPAASNRVVALKDPIRSAVTIELFDGNASRANIDFTPKDLLTKQCLEVLALTLPADWSFGLHVTFTDAWRSRRLSCAPDTEFECFKSALLTILEIEHHQADQAGAVSPWERLAFSTALGRFEDDVVLSGLRLPQRPSPKARPPRKRPHALLAPVLNALHMLGEDLRLMVHRHDDVHRLAGLICLIAGIIRPEWADYWKRFCPNVTSGWVHPAQEDAHSVSHGRETSFVDDRLPVWPSDMTAMFYGRINNPEWKLPWYDIRKLSSQFKLSPSYAYGRLEPLAYLRQLTLIYQCLADKMVEDSRKRAENAMHLMVSHKIGQGFLNVLPIGLAAPLREAARVCQLAPGQDWPAAAYEFVGRNDLAEGANVNPGLLTANGYRPVKEFLVSTLVGR